MGLRDWYLRRKATGLAHDIQEGKQGAMAENALGRFKASPGYRSAVMLLLLVLEGGARKLGFETGPLFLVVRTFFGAIGVNPTEATALGVDPEQLVTGLFSLYVSLHRLWTVYQERKAARLLKAAVDAQAARDWLAARADHPPIALPPPAEPKG